MCGGSRQLLKILNRIGCVSSPDTHDRFVTYHAELQRHTNVWNEIPEHTFTIASTDNIDKLQSYSAVYCGDQQRSYHGTTVQLVQPNPNLELSQLISTPNPYRVSPTSSSIPNPTPNFTPNPTPNFTPIPSPNRTPTPISFDIPATSISQDLDVNVTVQLQAHTAVVSTTANTTINSCTTVNRGIQPVATESPPPKSIFQQRRRNRLTSPSSSPHKLGKVGPKRRRTVAVQKLFAKNAQTPEHIQEARRNDYQLSLDKFKESEHERCEREAVQSKLFSYNAQKYVAQEFTDKMVINDVRQFFNLPNEDENCRTSKIYYMELVDENPDSDETMLEVAEDLLDKFTTETQQGWVVLVGDGKTYKHLMNIKRHYGQALQKLLIFPGDWHTLKNFQPVLMKVYYSAGLKELAMASGYRGSTLSSLESCSNFK